MTRKTTVIALVVILSCVIAIGGCAATKPTAADDSLPAEELAEVSVNDSVDADHSKNPVDTDSKHSASAAECESVENDVDQVAEPQCVETETSDEAILDRTQRTVHAVADKTTRWFDSFFGESKLSEGEHVSRGILSVSGLWDERDGFKSRFNLRARFALPALENRARLILGRGDTDDIVDGTSDEAVDNLPGAFDDNGDEDWLIGFGYNRSGNMSRGLDFGVGIRVATPLDPYVNVTYRWHKIWESPWRFRARARTFWQRERGTGITLDADLDYAISPTLMLRWANNFGVEDRVEGLGWRSDVIAYQGLSNNRAFSYSVFAEGETAAEVELQNYGFWLRYRQRVAREWFFIELAAGLSWPREFLIEERDSNVGVGVTFEMRFGRW